MIYPISQIFYKVWQDHPVLHIAVLVTRMYFCRIKCKVLPQQAEVAEGFLRYTAAIFTYEVCTSLWAGICKRGPKNMRFLSEIRVYCTYT